MSDSLPIVVYFCRYQDKDSAEKFACFFDSYKRHPAGCEHELFIIKKGFQEHESIWEAWIRQLDGIPFQIRTYPDRYFVFGYIRNLMEEFPDRYILLCTATNEIRADQWLDLYTRHANPDRVLAAMGSYWPHFSNDILTYGLPPLTLKNFLRSSSATRYKWWRQFWGYPPRDTFYNTDCFHPCANPHLRTNSLMVPPRLLERFVYWPRNENVVSKEVDLLFEMGKFSLTAQAIRVGLEPLVVGADGRSYTIGEWPQSKTYCSGDHENAIFADRLNRVYENSSIERKEELTKETYGYEQEDVRRFIEQVLSSDTSQIEAFFQKYGTKYK